MRRTLEVPDPLAAAGDAVVNRHHPGPDVGADALALERHGRGLAEEAVDAAEVEPARTCVLCLRRPAATAHGSVVGRRRGTINFRRSPRRLTRCGRPESV